MSFVFTFQFHAFSFPVIAEFAKHNASDRHSMTNISLSSHHVNEEADFPQPPVSHIFSCYFFTHGTIPRPYYISLWHSTHTPTPTPTPIPTHTHTHPHTHTQEKRLDLDTALIANLRDSALREAYIHDFFVVMAICNTVVVSGNGHGRRSEVISDTERWVQRSESHSLVADDPSSIVYEAESPDEAALVEVSLCLPPLTPSPSQ